MCLLSKMVIFQQHTFSYPWGASCLIQDATKWRFSLGCGKRNSHPQVITPKQGSRFAMNVPPLNITKERRVDEQIYLFRHFWDDVFWKDPPDMNLVVPTRVEVTSDIRPWFYVFFVAGIGLAFQGTLPSGNPKILRAIQVFASSNLLSWSLANCSNLAHSPRLNNCLNAELLLQGSCQLQFPRLDYSTFFSPEDCHISQLKWMPFLAALHTEEACEEALQKQTLLTARTSRWKIQWTHILAFACLSAIWTAYFVQMICALFVFCFPDVELGYALQRVLALQRVSTWLATPLLACCFVQLWAEVYKKKHISDLIACPMRDLLRGTSFIQVSLSITIKKHHCSKPYKITWI